MRAVSFSDGASAMTSEELLVGTYDLDDDLIDATRADRMPRVRVARVANRSVVIGKGSKPEAELNLDACIQDKVPVLKRHGGGCSVVLDPGNLIVSLVLPVREFRKHRKHFSQITRWLIDGLESVGVEGVYHDGISDLVFEDRKIGGSCLYCARDLLYYTSTLLVDPDLDRVSRYLKHPPREPGYRRGRPHGEFMGALSDRAWRRDIGELEDALRGALLPGEIMREVAGPSHRF